MNKRTKEPSEGKQKVLKTENVYEKLSATQNNCSKLQNFVKLNINNTSNPIDRKVLNTLNEDVQSCLLLLSMLLCFSL